MIWIGGVAVVLFTALPVTLLFAVILERLGTGHGTYHSVCGHSVCGNDPEHPLNRLRAGGSRDET